MLNNIGESTYIANKANSILNNYYNYDSLNITDCNSYIIKNEDINSCNYSENELLNKKNKKDIYINKLTKEAYFNNNISEENDNKEDNKLLKKIKSRLSGLKNNYNKSSVIFTILNLSKFESISNNYSLKLKQFTNIRELDLSYNNIKVIEDLSFITYLRKLNLSNNNITDPEPFETNNYDYLTHLNLSDNKITRFFKFKIPKLIYLNLNNNQIENLDNFKGHFCLEEICLSNNKLNSLNGILKSMANLKAIYANNNNINEFEDTNNLRMLEKINLRGNPLTKISTNIFNKQLIYINLRDTKIILLKEIQKIKSKYEIINIINTPLLEENSSIKLELLSTNKHIKKLNKEEISSEDLEEALEFEKNKEDNNKNDYSLEASSIIEKNN